MTENKIKESKEWLQDFTRMFGCNFDDLETRSFNKIVTYLEELQQYRAIGTIEEFKNLKKKSIPRKIKGIRFEEAICPRCESELFDTYWAFGGIHYCSNCGQTIDWQ